MSKKENTPRKQKITSLFAIIINMPYRQKTDQSTNAKQSGTDKSQIHITDEPDLLKYLIEKIHKLERLLTAGDEKENALLVAIASIIEVLI